MTEELPIPFPTHTGPPGKGRGGGIGYPDRAKSCDGHRCVIHDQECAWCGRFPAAVIDRTQSERALAVDRAARTPAPFYRFVYRMEQQLADAARRTAAA